MNETHMAVFCCLDNSYSLRRFLRIVFVFSWVNFLSKHTLCLAHVPTNVRTSKLKKKSYNSFAVNKMMTDLGCFVITEGHVSCSAVIITNYSIQLFFRVLRICLLLRHATALANIRSDPIENSRMCQFYAPSCICCRWALDSQKGFSYCLKIAQNVFSLVTDRVKLYFGKTLIWMFNSGWKDSINEHLH